MDVTVSESIKRKKHATSGCRLWPTNINPQNSREIIDSRHKSSNGDNSLKGKTVSYVSNNEKYKHPFNFSKGNFNVLNY